MTTHACLYGEQESTNTRRFKSKSSFFRACSCRHTLPRRERCAWSLPKQQCTCSPGCLRALHVQAWARSSGVRAPVILTITARGSSCCAFTKKRPLLISCCSDRAGRHALAHGAAMLPTLSKQPGLCRRRCVTGCVLGVPATRLVGPLCCFTRRYRAPAAAKRDAAQTCQVSGPCDMSQSCVFVNAAPAVYSKSNRSPEVPWES